MQPLFGSGVGKLGLALGALVVTASASFWVGRVSAPPDLTPAAMGAAAVATAPLSTSNIDALESGAPGHVPAEPKVPRDDVAEPRAVEAAVEPPAVDTAPPDTPAAPMMPLATDARRARQRGALPVGLGAEIERLARAEAALRQGRSSSALSELEPPAAYLVEQAAALRAIANCELGQAAAVQGAGEALRRWPGSAFAPRIRAACGL